MKPNHIQTRITKVRSDKTKDRMYDGVISGDLGKAPVILVWYCKDIKDGYKGLEYVSRQIEDGPECIKLWKKLWRSSCAVTMWGHTYKVDGEPKREAALVFFCKRFWRIRTVVHESSHVLKALYLNYVRRCARYSTTGKVDEILADLQASMVHELCVGGYKKLGIPKP